MDTEISSSIQVMLPNQESLETFEKQVVDLAKELGGEYDGWTTTVVT